LGPGEVLGARRVGGRILRWRLDLGVVMTVVVVVVAVVTVVVVYRR